jgi:HEAT repeat protein
MWLCGALWCAAGSSLFADDPTQLAAQAIRAGQTRDLQAIPALAIGLSDESQLVRQSTAWALSQMGGAVSDCSTELTAALADQDSKVRCAAATSLGHLGDKAWRAESALWQCTLDRDVDVRCAALIALRTVSVAKHSAALGALSECLQSPVADVQSEAMATATVIQSRWDDNEKKMLVPHLGRIFATAHDDLRLAAAVLLGDLGLPAAPAIPALANAADDLDEHVRAAALRTLGRLAEEVDRRWNQLPTEHRTALRRPCDIAAKTLAGQGQDSAEIASLTEQFRQLSAGIQLTAGERSVPVPNQADRSVSPKLSALQKSSSNSETLAPQAWKSVLAGFAICVGLGLLWLGWSHRKVETAQPKIIPPAATPDEMTVPAANPSPAEIESRRATINALSDAALDATAQLNRSLHDDDAVARWRSASALTAVHNAGVPQLLAAVTSNDPEVRRLAVTSLRGLGANAVPPFVQALQDKDASVRHAAAVTLGQIGLGAIDAVPQLTSAITDADPHVRAAAAFSLSAFGPYAMEAVPSLRAALSDEFAIVRTRAAFALGQIGSAARRASETLARLVSDPDVSVRRNSVSALGGIGADAAVARPALLQALNDHDAVVRRYAVTALALIDTGNLAVDLRHALQDSDADVRRCAASVLGMGNHHAALSTSETLKLYCPEQAVTAEPVLDTEHILDATDFIAQLEDSDSDVRWRASQELSRLGASAVPEMIASLGHRNPDVRRSLIHVLGRVGIEARSALAPMLVALHDANADVRSAAADCLGRIGVVSRPMVQQLMQSLTDAHSEVRRYAATTLGRFGQHSREALTALQVAAISDISVKVRVAAQAAMQRISESLTGAA